MQSEVVELLKVKPMTMNELKEFLTYNKNSINRNLLRLLKYNIVKRKTILNERKREVHLYSLVKAKRIV